MTRTYVVTTAKYGELRKVGDSIAEVRAWARQNFGPGTTVCREYRRCSSCDCAPCECPRRRRA